LIALVCLWRESILCQQAPLHMAILRNFGTTIAGFPKIIAKAICKY
jgi:hypothetical protein